MPRFIPTLWDVNGYLLEKRLSDATNVRIEEEINGVHRLLFQYPIGDDHWDDITFRKIIRLEDTYVRTVSDIVIAVSAANKTVTVDTGSNFTVGEYVIVFDNSPPTQSFVAEITGIASDVLTLSRYDFTPTTGVRAEVRTINFDTYRITRVRQVNQGDTRFVEVECNHISYDLGDTLFLRDGRSDFTWGIRGSGSVQAENIDPDGLLDAIIASHIDENSDPIDVLKFHKGTLTGIYTGNDYNTGTISVTNGDESITGSGTTWTGFENAVMYIEGDPHRYYISSIGSSTAIELNIGVKRSTASGLRYLITRDRREVSFGDDTLRSALITMCEEYTDHAQTMWFEVKEDKAIDLKAERLLDASHADSADPTSSLIVEYDRAGDRNAEAIEREFDPKDFGNVLMPKGASGNWINATSNVNASVSSTAGDANNIPLAAADLQKFRWGDSLYVFQSPTSFTVNTAGQTTATISPASFAINGFAGGLILITSAPGKGQVRRVMGNTADTININRRWDIPPIGATAIVAKTINETQCRGFGVTRHKIDDDSAGGGSGSDYIQVNDLAPTYGIGEYTGGLIAVTNGLGVGEVHTILYNDIGDFDSDADDNDVRFYVDGELDSTGTTGHVDIIGLSQYAFDLPADFLQTRVSNTVFTIKTATVAQTQWIDTLWSVGSTGKVMFTHGTGKGTTIFPITASVWDGSNWRITVTGTLPSMDSTTEGVMWRVNDSFMMGVEDLTFDPSSASSDEVVMLLHETGGPLTPGKHSLARGTVQYSTSTVITLQSGEGEGFRAGMAIFVGAKTISSTTLFGLRRGDQTQGEMYRITSVSSDDLTVDGKIDPIPVPGDHVEVVALADNTSISTYGRREKSFETDTSDPVELLRKGSIFLDMISTPRPRYSIKFAHLYEYDPVKWESATYNLGDTIRVIDDELGVDTSNLRIVKHSYNVETPVDRQVEVSSTGTRRISDIVDYLLTDSVPVPAATLSPTTLGAVKTGGGQSTPVTLGSIKTGGAAVSAPAVNAPICAYWDEDGRYCRRLRPHNTFCLSEESNRDGRLTAAGRRIRLSDCQSFTRVKLRDYGIDTAGIGYTADAYGMRIESGVTKVTDVTNTEKTTYIGSAENVNFEVTHVVLSQLQAEDTVATYLYEADYGNTAVAVKRTVGGGTNEVLNPHNYVMSLAAADNNDGNGFAFTAQAPATKTYDTYVQWVAWGRQK